MINEIQQSCDKLKLSGVLQTYQVIADECSKTGASYSEYLNQLLIYELAIREQRSREVMLKLAGFPVLKKLENYDFASSNVNQMQVQELANLQFINNNENVILIGSTGTGKTHLAISLAYLATQKRMKVKFLSIADLIPQMDAAMSQNRLKNYMSKIIAGPSLLVLDEFGYIKLNETQANFIFQIVNKHYETGSIIITSNLTFGQWQGVLAGFSGK